MTFKKSAYNQISKIMKNKNCTAAEAFAETAITVGVPLINIIPALQRELGINENDINGFLEALSSLSLSANPSGPCYPKIERAVLDEIIHIKSEIDFMNRAMKQFNSNSN